MSDRETGGPGENRRFERPGGDKRWPLRGSELRLALSAAAILLCASGCGSDDGQEPTASAPSASDLSAAEQLDLVCADPQGWYDFGFGTSELILSIVEYEGGTVARFDEVDVALLARHSRDAARFAEQAPDSELSAAYLASAEAYAQVAEDGEASMNDGMNLMALDRKVADRCDLLIAESDTTSP